MTSGQFRCAFFARDYQATVTFYRDGLEMPVIAMWDRGQDDRGTLFAAASGIIEVLALPVNRKEGSVWDYRAPQGVFMVVEVEDVDELYGRVAEKGLSVKDELRNQPWGHRSFMISDPEGVNLYFFSEVTGPSSA